MFALNRYCLGIIIFAGGKFALAAEQVQVQMTSQITQTEGQIGLGGVSNAALQKKTNGSLTSLEVTSARLQSGLQVLASVQQMKNDYSNYILIEESGQQKNLKSFFDQPETQGSVSLDWIFENHDFHVKHEASLSSTPFPARWTQLGQSVQLNHQLTEIEWQIGWGQTEQPLSFFTDPQTALLRQRATSLDSRLYQVSWQQVMTARNRTQLDLSWNEKSDRPSAVAIKLSSVTAITSKDFLRVDGTRSQENRGMDLKDERGYFDLSSAEIGYSRYITYDLSLSVGYGLVVERENNPQTLRTDQMATDVYSFKVDYQGVDWKAGVRYQQLASNVEYQSTIYAGDFAWSF